VQIIELRKPPKKPANAQMRALEGYGGDIVLIIPGDGAPDTADFPLQYDIAAETTPV